MLNETMCQTVPNNEARTTKSTVAAIESAMPTPLETLLIISSPFVRRFKAEFINKLLKVNNLFIPLSIQIFADRPNNRDMI